MTRRADILCAWEEKILETAYGLEEFTIRQVAELAGGGQDMYRLASDVLKLRFEMGALEKVQEGGGRRRIIYRWTPE